MPPEYVIKNVTYYVKKTKKAVGTQDRPILTGNDKMHPTLKIDIIVLTIALINTE